MLLTKPHDPIQAVGLGEGNTFTIAASAKAFEILSSNLYQNKTLAVIREITCNAADAHRRAGKDLTSIKVHLPTFGEPYFSVRDFGLGLSREAVMHLYTTYFLSDKDCTNDEIGGFGLGSKSPFAVVDQFTVTSWHGGTRTDYVMYKDSGVPNVNIIRSEPSAEPTGMEVKLAVQKDPANWHIEAKNFFMWWPVLPTISTNLTIETVFDPANVFMSSDTLLDGNPEWVFLRKAMTSKVVVFMGLVPYAVELSAIPNVSQEITKLQNIGSGTLCLAFKVGDLGINPSRETLSYDPETCRKLLARLSEIVTALTVQMQKHLDAMPTLQAAREFVWGTNGLNTIARGNTTYMWKGQRVLQHAQVNFRGPKNAFATELTAGSLEYRNYYSKKWRNNRLAFYDTVTHDVSPYRNVYYYVWMPGPITAKTYRTIQHHFDNTTPTLLNESCHVVVLAGSTYADVSSALDAAGFPTILDGSTFDEPPKVARSPRGANSTVAQGYTFTTSGWNREETALDLKGGGVWVEFYDGKPVADATMLKAAFLFEGTTQRIMGFRRAKLSDRFKKKLATEGWIEYNPATWWHTNVTSDYLKAAAIEHKLWSFLRAGPGYTKILQYVLNSTKNLQTKLPGFTDMPIAKVLQRIHMSVLMASYIHLPDWCSPTQKAAIATGTAAATNFCDGLEAFVEHHFMLKHVNWSQLTLDMEAFEAYVTR